MFYQTKIAMFFLVVAIWLTSYIDRCAPYWPIEISRTATGPIGKIVFPTGAVILTIIGYFETMDLEHQWIIISPCVGFLLAAFVHDELHWQTHLFGVALICGAVFLNLAYCFAINDPDLISRICFFLLAQFLSGIYILLKIGAVIDEPHKVRSWIRAMSEPMATMEKCMKINYHGHSDEKVVTIYKATGVPQWVIFSFLISTY